MLRVDGLGCGFAGSGVVLGPVSFAVGRGELLVVAGPSGTGKSTLLRALAGLERHRGEIGWADGRGTVGVVFQEPRLMPWLDVRANVGFGLRGDGRRERVAELLRLVGLADAGSLLPKQLSGGMAQRAALARGLAARPDVLLLDEPFSALDPENRARLGEHLRELQARLGTTMVLVTHDVAEAGRLGDRVLVLGGRPGRIVAEIPGPARGAREVEEAAWRRQLAARLRGPVVPEPSRV
ncbi:MAG: ABC transporter ATP-binding protein [Gluconacetobacter diazotrophicus]|nr:ABC transporter ATP-binding protein [Gluconacetobacter diazotrophicus]